MFVPVEADGLKLHVLQECYYHNHNKSKSKYHDTLSQSPILHHEFTKDVATKLCIPSLISKVLSGNTNKSFKPWGQRELLPLTLELKDILEVYKDGLAMIKELIQNADDAGANQVKFLYDQRGNEDLKSHLIDPAMADWQGPALWVFNEKKFSEDDFKNITNIRAATYLIP